MNSKDEVTTSNQCNLFGNPSQYFHEVPNIRVVFVARKFANVAGGLERISIDLMNELVRRGYQVGLMTWDEECAMPHYPIDQRVDWLKLNISDSDISAGINDRIARLLKFRNFLKIFEPNIVIGFQSGASLFSWIATVGLKTKLIAAERISPDLWKYTQKKFLNRILDVHSLVLADKITVQFPEYIQKYPRIMRKKMVSIHNPVPRRVLETSNQVSDKNILLYVARFCFQKNHDLLINAFSMVSDSFKDWYLVLAGDGEYQECIHNQVANLKLNDRVKFCGAVVDVDGLYKSADIMAFPSFFEGFPNALAEALAHGVPCVGLRDTLGVNSLIQDGLNGLLVDSNPEAFAHGLKSLMEDKQTRLRMSAEARKIVYKYEPEAAYRQWELLFEDITK